MNFDNFIETITLNLENLENRVRTLDKLSKQYNVVVDDVNKLYRKVDENIETVNSNIYDYFFEMDKRENESLADVGRRYHSQFPVATGLTRLCQLQELFLLKKLDELLTRMEIKYSMDFGNLLGYERSGRFIPWDDDVDINIDIDDLIKLIDQINKHDDYKDFEISVANLGRPRFGVKGFPQFVDLFPMVETNSRAEFKANKRLFKSLKRRRSKELLLTTYNNKTSDPLGFIKEVRSIYIDNKKNIDEKNLSKEDEPHLVRIAFLFHALERPTPKRSVYPTKRVVFDGVETYIPNSPDFLLQKRYGDYWKYPISLPNAHTTSTDKKAIIKFCDFIKNNDNEFYSSRIESVLIEAKEEMGDGFE